MTQPTGFGEFPRTFSSGVITNPGVGAVLVDTGPFDKSRVFKVLVLISATVGGAEIDIQHRNAANAANIDLVPVFTGANATVEPLFYWFVETNERVRVVSPASVTGFVSVAVHVLQAVAGHSIGFA